MRPLTHAAGIYLDLVAAGLGFVTDALLIAVAAAAILCAVGAVRRGKSRGE